MGVVNLPGGKPTMHLTGGAAARLERLLPPGHRALIHLTITDDFPLAQAFVIIEALPAEHGHVPRIGACQCVCSEQALARYMIATRRTRTT